MAIRWVADVGNDTFSGCESLINIDTNHIVSFGDRSFMGCTSLERLDVMEGVSEIGDEAFAGCSSLASVDIPDAEGLCIGAGAFSGCDSLRSFSIDGDVTILGDHAFSGCVSLSELTFLDDTCQVGSDAFIGCGELTYLHIRSPEVLAELDFGDGLGTLVIGGGITAIGERTFPSLTGLSVLILEEGVVSVADGAFTASDGLELIPIPNSVEEIGTEAFYVPGPCMVAGSVGCLDGHSVADPVYGYLITYDVSGRPDVADRTEYGWARQGDRVVPDHKEVGGCTVSSFIGEDDVSAGFTMPDAEVIVTVTYDDGERIVMFYDRDILIYYTWVRLGDPVPLPEDPYVPPLEGYSYEFMGWEGLFPGNVVTGSKSYNSMYRMNMTNFSGWEIADGCLVFDDRLDSPLYLTDDSASALLERTAAEGVDGVTFSFEYHDRAWMTLSNDDLELIDGDGLTMYVKPDLGTFIYSVTVEGPDGITVDVDLPWMTSNRTTAVNVVLGTGATEGVESEAVWHDGYKYVRFTANGSGNYETFNTGLETEVKLAIVGMAILAIIVIILAIWYVHSKHVPKT